MWHVRAEAQRQVRTADVPVNRASVLVDLLVEEVLERRSIALAGPGDNIEEPDALRRIDGSSVYTVAGADLYTSRRILDAEQRLLTAAGRRDGASVEQTVVDLALLEMAANGTALDVGQAALVRQMCSSGARVQLAIAPAGTGKTTAMRALTQAWTEDLHICLSAVPWWSWLRIGVRSAGVTIRGPIRSSGRGFPTRRRVGSIWLDCAGRMGSPVRAAAVVAAGGRAEGCGCAPIVG
jgi:hypothetical protein